MVQRAPEYGLELLLAFDGRIHHLEEGYWIKFEIEPRLIDFDNAHSVPAKGGRFKRKPLASDHLHRTETDPGRPYQFKDAETLIDDFFAEVERVLDEHGIDMTVVEVKDTRRSK